MLSLLLKLAAYLAAGAVGLLLAKLVFKKRGDAKSSKRNENEDHSGSEDEFEKIETHEGDDLPHITYQHGNQLSSKEMVSKSEDFYNLMRKRRSVRFFSNKPVDRVVIENCIRTAGTSPSGANQQPWYFAVVESLEMKRQLREIVEAEEELNYTRRMGERWVRDLRPLRTDWNKPYLEKAPFIIAVFRINYLIDENGDRQPVHYGEISCSIAVGLLLAAIQQAGLVTVTTTPLNCGPAIRTLLDRPANEKLVFILPIGHPAADATVPDLGKKELTEIMNYY